MTRVTHHPEIAERLRARWCGPAAMSAATGLSAEECAAAINRSRGRPAHYQTQGVGFNAIARYIADLGFRVRAGAIDRAKPPTIRKFATERSADEFLRPIVFWTRDHFIVLDGKTLVDSHHPDGIPWRDYGKLRTKVLGFYTVERNRNVKQGLKGWSPKDHSDYARKKNRVATY